MRRLFVAIDIPESIKDYILEFCKREPGLKWTNSSQFHITLRFLGDTEDTLFDNIKSVLSDIECSSFELTFDRTGFFPNRRRPSVFWLGCAASDGALALKTELDFALNKIGLSLEERVLVPHLTLMRIRKSSNRGIGGKLEALFSSFSSNAFVVNKFCLYSSVLDFCGATHKKEAEYNLFEKK